MNKKLENTLLHIKRQKHLYELLFVCLAIALSYLSIREARKATEISMNGLELGRQSLAIQRDEFVIRNRPYIVLLQASFGGPSKDTAGRTYEHTIDVALSNISDIPANNLRAEYTPLLDDRKVGFTAVVAGALAKDNPLSGKVFISGDIYQAITNSAHRFSVDALVTYSGMLGGTQLIYATRGSLVYDAIDSGFKFTQLRYE